MNKIMNYLRDYIRPIYCELEACLTDGMPLEFPSTAAYELHYETQHHNVCVVCSRIFPGSQWLHLHLDECHNVLKQMEKERGQNIYQCYVQGCQEKSAEPYLRRQHLIEQHQYPSYFPFNIVITGNLSFEERWRRDKGQEDMVEDSVMDEITSAMSRLTIPKSISFGQVEPSIWR
ncbi:hypothetical protein DFQ30_006482 [Apophysomyces sp. BC1015]|nr:hypothetical protein DFQ30_006482 [Apophysomyces sp. BC1015]